MEQRTNQILLGLVVATGLAYGAAWWGSASMAQLWAQAASKDKPTNDTLACCTDVACCSEVDCTDCIDCQVAANPQVPAVAALGAGKSCRKRGGGLTRLGGIFVLLLPAGIFLFWRRRLRRDHRTTDDPDIPRR